MKRTKAKSSAKEQDAGTDFWAKPVEPEKSWEESTASQPEEAFTPYTMGSTFTKGQLVVHPKFGKGVITGVEAVRVEILFEGGKKKLGHSHT